jgi:hypothetical protein
MDVFLMLICVVVQKTIKGIVLTESLEFIYNLDSKTVNSQPTRGKGC